jgi:molecular chaperone Hsp33
MPAAARSTRPRSATRSWSRWRPSSDSSQPVSQQITALQRETGLTLFQRSGRGITATPAGELLHRLFHEEHPELLGDKALRFACSCSRERVQGMLQSLGEEEARAAAEPTGAVEVRCEFCGQEYHFPLTEFDILFREMDVSSPAPERLQ